MLSTFTTVFQSSPIRIITTITVACLLAVLPKASYSFVSTRNYNTIIIISSRSSSCTFHRLRLFPFIQRTRNPQQQQQQQKVSSIQSLRGESSSALFATLGPRKRNYYHSSTRSFTSLLSPFDHHHHHQFQTRRQQQQQQQQQVGISLFSSVSDSNNKVNNIMVETKIRRSSRKAVKRKVPATTATANDDDDDKKESVKTSKETIQKNNKSSNESDSDNDSTASTSKPSKKKKVKTTSTSPTTKKKTKKKKKKKVEQQAITKKDPLPKLWDAQKAKTENGSYTFKILSWNVNGIRAVLKKDPDTFVKLVKQYDADMLCLQETKIQEIHVKDLEDVVLPGLGGGYTSYWSCSTSKKGYAGTVVFVRDRGGERAKADKDENKTSTEAEATATATATADTKKKKQTSLQSFFGKKPSKKKATKATTTTATTDTTSDFDFDYSQFIPSTVSYGLGKEKHDTEGRMVTLDFPLFSITNVYTPNSSEKLVRIDYRTQEWDEDFVKFHYDKLKNKDGNKSSRGVIWLGDLNVAHGKMDMWNYGAKHLEKTPGCTERERISFQEQLDYKSNDEDKDTDQKEEEEEEDNEEPKCTPGSTFIDAFRHFHPDKWGHYSWWSVRAGNRPVNKGLRLDYFICSKNMFEEDQKVTVRDSYILPDQMGSDHCPIVLELEVKK